MKLDFRQRLLATTLLVGAGMVASPAFAQNPSPAPECPPGTPAGTAGCSPADTATGSQPETTAPVEGTTPPSTSATGENVKSAGDIVITGTRIPQPNLTSASPVTVLSSQEVKLSGTTRTEDLINSLPQSFAAQGSNVSNGASGIATVNLRGLGSKRTAVLINGRRLQPGDPRTPTGDTNFVPASLIKRVDVLTGGASSVYGADAVAGVVNFIMDTNFRGLRVDAQGSFFQHNNNADDKILVPNQTRNFRPPHGNVVDGGAQDISAAFGAGFDDNRGSILAYATYRKQDSVLQADRDYSFCSITARATRQSGSPARDFNCGGSGTSANGTFFTNVGTFQVGGPAGNQFVAGNTPFNFAPYNYYQRPDERYTLGAFAEYEISPGAKPYVEAMFMDDRSDAQIAPSGDFFSTTTINCDNPLLSTQQFNTICVPANTFVDAQGITRAVAYTGRRNVEGGGRDDNVEHTAWRLVGGIRGDFLRGLSYDTYYQFGTTRLSQIYRNDFSVTRLNRALDVISNPAVGGVAGVPAGTPVCRSALPGTGPGGGALDAACVPWNIFQTGGVTQAALDYLQTPGFSHGNVNEIIANANITLEGGEYGLQTPWSDRGIGLNVGGEYRKESLRFDVDEAFRTGDLAGQGGPTPPVSGSFDVREAFAEIQVPIVSHSFFEELTLGAGYRYSDYKIADHHFNTDTYKVSLEFAPIHDVRARGSYNRAVRAPNIVELFTPVSVALGGTTDPCAGATPAATPAQCALTGVTAAQYGTIQGNPAGQYNSQFGGFAGLQPETADTYTFGVVLQPRFVPGLAVTVDYFNIKVKDVIGTIGFNTIMTQCITSGDPFFCSRINRANGNGSLWLPVTDPNNGGYIVDLNSNVGGLKTSGIDVNASYARRIGGMGTLNASMVGTWLSKLITSPLEGIAYDCAGFYGLQCGTPNPVWRHKMRVGFTLPNGLGISGQWRYFSKVKDDTLSSDPDLAVPPLARPFDEQLNAKSYFDLALTARLADRYNFRMGVNNLLDTAPPLSTSTASGAYGARAAPPFGNGNTFPQVYDSLGRYLFAGVTIDF